MAPPPKRPVLQLAVVTVLAAVLALLAVLQYSWSLEISRAERARIEAGLNASVAQFRQEFNRELAQLCAAFHREPSPEPDGIWENYANRYQEWSRSTAHPDLLAGVYVFRADERGGMRLMRLAPAFNRFENVELPAAFTSLQPRLETEMRRPFGPPDPEARPFGWTFEGAIPALVHPVLQMAGPRWRMADRPGPQPRILGFVILELSGPAVEQHLLAELAQRYFGGTEGFVYNVAVIAGGSPANILYRSDAQIGLESLNPPDARSPLLGPPAAERHVPGDEAAVRAWPYRPGRGPGAMMLRVRTPMIVPAPGSEPWQLLVRHRGGSLEAVVAAGRRRNLVLSFGVLALLAASMALIMVSSQRARRLANLQMEFVAGVSHELRTPVSVICSAADNLAEGHVGARDQVKEYGALIRNEGRRLAGMIEQILHFAAGQAGRTRYDLQAVSVPEVIENALAGAAALPETAGCTAERHFDPGLPPVLADPSALTRCLQNLILNAWKYGGEGRWARVTAESAEVEGASRIRLRVEDRGPGIDPADLPHIFEPFYRGKAARAAQIHGAGLGLSLAREIAKAMGGCLTVSSEPSHGSVFTLDLPAAGAAREVVPHSA